MISCASCINTIAWLPAVLVGLQPSEKSSKARRQEQRCLLQSKSNEIQCPKKLYSNLRFRCIDTWDWNNGNILEFHLSNDKYLLIALPRLQYQWYQLDYRTFA